MNATATILPLRATTATQSPRENRVTVCYGANVQKFAMPEEGIEVRNLASDTSIAEAVGLKGQPQAFLVNGTQVPTTHRAMPGDEVEFVRRAGEKA
jgi:hypothetical protein